MLEKGDSIALIAMSNLNTWKEDESLEKLILILENYGLKVEVSKSLVDINLDNKLKAKEFNEFFKKDYIKAIFDISGGDRANATLEYIDWNAIKESKTVFYGMSDLTVFLNSIYAKTKEDSGHFMLKNIFERDNDFYKEFFLGEGSLDSFQYEFWKGDHIKESIVLGGNIRCLLKLAGTDYIPSFNDNILLLESLSGNWERINTMLIQLKHLHIFDNINGLILGEFSQLERELDKANIKKLFNDFFSIYNFPIIKTQEIGHGRKKGLIYIGKKYNF